jgi:Sec-independent protein translocase protein TatA
MDSLGTQEMMVVLVLALIVFGPLTGRIGNKNRQAFALGSTSGIY